MSQNSENDNNELNQFMDMFEQEQQYYQSQLISTQNDSSSQWQSCQIYTSNIHSSYNDPFSSSQLRLQNTFQFSQPNTSSFFTSEPTNDSWPAQVKEKTDWNESMDYQNAGSNNDGPTNS